MSEKKYIKAQKLRDLPEAELRNRVRELKSQQYANRFDRTVGRLENYGVVQQTRRRLAAVLTILKEKELAAASGKGGN
jgi:ribosomal protein L29